jgi:hypothetical protein
VAVVAATSNRNQKLTAQVATPVVQESEARSEPSVSEAVGAPVVSEQPRVIPTPESVVPAGFEAARDASDGATKDSPRNVSSEASPQLDQLRIASRKLEKQLKILFPESKVSVLPVQNKLLLKGQAESTEEAARILQIVASAMMKHFIADVFEPEDVFDADMKSPQVSTQLRDDFIVNLLEVEQVSISLNVQTVELDQKKIRTLASTLSYRCDCQIRYR